MRLLAWLTLITQVLIVGTGGAVRLTGSGLGCPTWPLCTDASLVSTPEMGILYLVTAALSGLWFLFEAHRLYAGAIRDTEARPMRVFHASITYLTLVFLAVGLDPLLHLPVPF